MKDLKELLEAQKAMIQKDLEQNGHDSFKLKCEKSKLEKMLKNVDKQLETVNEEPVKS